MANDFPRFISAAWVFNPVAGARPDRLERKLHGKVQEALDKDGLHLPMIAPEWGAFWRQGHRMVEAMAWVCHSGPGRIRPPTPSVQSSWVWEQEGGSIVPKSEGSELSWPTLEDSVNHYPEILDGPASAVALSEWKDEFEALESSPPWVHWALQADQKMLRAELEQCAWSKQDVGHWWRLMEGLLADTGRHWEVRIIDGEVSTSTLPISDSQARREVIQILGLYLPPHARRPARLSGLAPSPEKGGQSAHHEIVSSVLKGWVSPSRFWSLRRALHWNDLREQSHTVRIWDFEQLPRAVAHRTLDKFAETTRLAPPPVGTRLPLLERVHQIAPQWPGWLPLLETFADLDTLTPALRSTLATLKEKDMAVKIAEAQPSTVPAPVRGPSRF